MTAPQSMLNGDKLSPDRAVIELCLTLPISFNSYKNQHGHTTKRGRIWRDLTVDDIYRQCGGRPEPLIGRCGIWYELWLPDDNRRRDADNYSGKHVLDALVKAGVIEDDNSKNITELHTFFRGKSGKGWLRIRIMEI